MVQIAAANGGGIASWSTREGKRNSKNEEMKKRNTFWMEFVTVIGSVEISASVTPSC
jgi:hypothetical protein